MSDMSSSFSAPRLTLSMAEEKLLGSQLGHNVNLRVRFQHPSDIAAEDVHVKTELNLERGAGNPRRKELATAVAEKVDTHLSYYFNAPKDEAKLFLKVFVCDVAEGDRESRILAPDSKVGLVRLCLAWVLCFADGSVVLDGGRVGVVDHHLHGLYDMLFLKSGESTLVNRLSPKLCTQIKDSVEIRSRSWLACCQ